MIPKYNGFEKKKFAGAREVLPAGGYVGKILKAEVLTYSWGSKLQISFDVTEGDYKDFFRHDWDNNQNEDRKWRGVLKLNLPKGDGSQEDTWKQNAINNLAASLEESNPGYTWDWDEAKLKGLALGFLVRDYEWRIDDRTGWATEASSCTDVDSIRNKKFRIPKAKPLKNNGVAPSAPLTFQEMDAGDPDDLPF